MIILRTGLYPFWVVPCSPDGGLNFYPALIEKFQNPSGTICPFGMGEPVMYSLLLDPSPAMAVNKLDTQKVFKDRCHDDVEILTVVASDFKFFS